MTYDDSEYRKRDKMFTARRVYAINNISFLTTYVKNTTQIA